MRVNLGIWDKLNRAVVVLLFLAGALGVFFWYLPLIHTNQRYRQHIIELDNRYAEELRIDKQITAAQQATLYDTNTLERLAREKLGYARTNETVIRFEPAERLRQATY